LRDQEIYPEGRVLVLEKALQLRNLFPQHVWCVADAADDAQAAGIRDCGSELGTGGHIHTGEHDRVVDLEEVGRCGAELFWGTGVSSGEMDRRAVAGWIKTYVERP